MATATVVDLAGLPAMLTMRQVQEVLGISRPKVYELAHTQGFPAIRIGRTIRVPRQSLVTWIEAQAGMQEGL